MEPSLGSSQGLPFAPLSPCWGLAREYYRQLSWMLRVQPRVSLEKGPLPIPASSRFDMHSMNSLEDSHET